jgi:hypothetical protein
MVVDNSSTQFLKHLALGFCPSDRWGLSEASMPLASMERRFVRKSGAGDADFIFLLLKSLGVHGLKRKR